MTCLQTSSTRLPGSVPPPADFVGVVHRADGTVERWRYGRRVAAAGTLRALPSAEAIERTAESLRLLAAGGAGLVAHERRVAAAGASIAVGVEQVREQLRQRRGA